MHNRTLEKDLPSALGLKSCIHLLRAASILEKHRTRCLSTLFVKQKAFRQQTAAFPTKSIPTTDGSSKREAHCVPKMATDVKRILSFFHLHASSLSIDHATADR